MRRTSLSVKSLVKKAYYGGYPVSRNSERLNARDSASSRTVEQEATLESHNPAVYDSQSRSLIGDKDVKPRMDRVYKKLKRKRKGRPPRDPMSTAILSRSEHNEQETPASSNAKRLDHATVAKNSDTMGMIFKGAAQLRHLAKRQKKRKSMDKGVQGSEAYLEGGRLPGNEGGENFSQGYQSRHQILGGIRPGRWT